MSISIAVIGECMLELSRADANGDVRGLPMTMNYGGDTLNTSVYLNRCGINTRYVTALGDDIMSDWMLGEWQDEGIDCSLVVRKPNSVPGMYMINVADDGERSFYYWRKNSPASRLFDDRDHVEKLFESLKDSSHLYLSGISLGILPEKSLQCLFDSLKVYRQAGGKIIFDGNYRPKLWSNETAAQQAYTQMYGMTDIALPTLEDETSLFGIESAEQLVKTLQAHGVQETVVKMGADGCLFATGQALERVSAVQVTPVDTTAAGDSFNAGFLAARLRGISGVDACRAGHALASQVIQHRGAIIPRNI
ncbi:MAG: sugar kinase [Pseudomonadales bacterium]